MEGKQEHLQENEGESNEKMGALNKNIGDSKQEVERKQEDLHTNVEESNERNYALNQSPIEGMPEVEGKEEDLQANNEGSNEKICELNESPMEAQDEKFPAVTEESNEEICELGQTEMEGQQEHIQANAEEPNVIVEVAPHGGVVIDAAGVPFEDNITDCVRREPIFCDIDSDSESVSSSLSVSSLSSFSSLEDISDPNKSKKSKAVKPSKTKGELGIEDLPPVETLTISVPEDDMQEIGKVYCIVDKLVVVESFMNSPALNFDSVLFLSHGKPLGNIFEVFGPVRQPYYLIRFNSNVEIVQSGIAKDDSVFYAPSHSNITGFIFTESLMQQKGSDASWEHNNEPPEEHLDFSDDEKERAARWKRAAKNRKPEASDDSVTPKRPSLPTDTESDGASDISIISSSSSYSGLCQYRNTNVLSSFSSRAILKPPSRLGPRAYEKRVDQGAVFTPQHTVSRSFTSFHPRPPLPQTSPIGHQGVNENAAFAPRNRNLTSFLFSQPWQPQQTLGAMPPSTPELQSHHIGINRNAATTLQNKFPGNFAFSQPLQPQQMSPGPAPPQSMGLPPREAGNVAITLQDRVPGSFSFFKPPPQMQPPSPAPALGMGPSPHYEAVNGVTLQDRVSGSFSFSEPPPQMPLSSPAPPLRLGLPPPPQMPPSSPAPPLSMGLPHHHEGVNGVTLRDRVRGSFTFFQRPPQMPPASPAPPVSMGLPSPPQMHPPSPAPPVSMGLPPPPQIPPPSPAPPLNMRLPPHREGVNGVTLQERVRESFPFFQPPPQMPPPSPAPPPSIGLPPRCDPWLYNHC